MTVSYPQFEILAHRGWWTNRDDRNSMSALERALGAGFGVETDIRDRAGELVISHDPPGTEALPLSDLLTLYRDRGWQGTLGLNIKADGLAEGLVAQLQAFGIANYFTFDMSVPDTLGYLRLEGGKPFTRWSEYESGSSLDHRVSGLWLDAFVEPFVDPADIRKGLALGKVVAIVSPELHGKPHDEAWQMWREVTADMAGGSRLMLCTDYPDQARAFFDQADEPVHD